jgi:hypothetical protein
MMASSAVATVPTPAAVPAGFLSVSDAAARLGKSERQVRRDCEGLEPLGLAVKVAGEWYISKASGDPRLLDYETREGRDLRQSGELRREGFSASAVARAEALKSLVLESWEFNARAHDQEGQLREFLNHLFAIGRLPNKYVKKVKPDTFRKWRDQYRADGLRGLIRKQYSERGTQAIGAKAWERFLENRHAGTGVSITEAWRLTLGEIEQRNLQGDPDWAWPISGDRRTCPRAVQQKYKDDVPEPVKVHVDQGPHRYRAKCHPKITRCLEDVPAGSHFVLDQRVMDFQCRVPSARGTWRRARPKLTATMDVRSRGLWGWVLGEFANSEAILSSFKMCCEVVETLPDEVTVDNGRDYRSVAGRTRRGRTWDEFDQPLVFGCFERLRARVHSTIVKWAWGKSIESRFHTIKDRFDRHMASFWGGKPDERPWDADRWSRERIDLLPTMEEASDLFAEFLAGLHEEPIGGDGAFNLCPRQILAQFFTPNPREANEDVLLFACTRMRGPVKVGRDGIRHNNIFYGKWNEELPRWMGREVYFLADPARGDHITVCNKDGVPLWVAYADNNLGQTSEEVRAAMAAKRRADRILKEYPAARDVSLRTTTQQIMERRLIAAKLSQAPDGELPPPPKRESVRLVRPDIAKGAAEIKRAAGAETLRRLSGTNAAVEAVSRPRPITLADLAATDAGSGELNEEPVRRITLAELSQTTEANSDAP